MFGNRFPNFLHGLVVFASGPTVKMALRIMNTLVDHFCALNVLVLKCGAEERKAFCSEICQKVLFYFYIFLMYPVFAICRSEEMNKNVVFVPPTLYATPARRSCAENIKII